MPWAKPRAGSGLWLVAGLGLWLGAGLGLLGAGLGLAWRQRGERRERLIAAMISSHLQSAHSKPGGGAVSFRNQKLTAALTLPGSARRERTSWCQYAGK